MKDKSIAGISDKGQKRSNNEDSFVAETIPGTGMQLAAVIDGVGGYEGGEIAADITCKCFLTHQGELKENIIPQLKQIIAEANQKIFEARKADPSKSQMACVLTAAVTDADNNKFYYAHVGDTRLYLLRDGSLVKISHDHSPIGFLEETGRLTEAAAMKHPRRNEINKALGFQGDIDIQGDFIEASESPFLPGDMLLLCSDGLTDMIESSTILEILLQDTSLDQKTKTLVDAANAAGGEDNITLVLVHNNNPSTSQKALRPAAAAKEQKQEHKKSGSLKQDVKSSSPLITDSGSRKKKFNVIPLLIVLCVGLACLSMFLYFQKPATSESIPAPAINVSPSETELDFARYLGDSPSKTLTLSGQKDIILTGPVHFSKDSVSISGGNTNFIADSSYNGPAFIFEKSVAYIKIDSLLFSGFSPAILLQGQPAILKNIQFNNCPVHVAQQAIFPGGNVNINLPGFNQSFKDSLP
ncbi:MAG: protein phosphatase 2C domain-containing protein [Ferruginibacter sp.]